MSSAVLVGLLMLAFAAMAWVWSSVALSLDEDGSDDDDDWELAEIEAARRDHPCAVGDPNCDGC